MKRKAKLGSLRHFYEWLKGEPGYTTYDYGSNTDCLLARYAKSNGLQNVHVGAFGRVNTESKVYKWPNLARIANQAGTYPQTYVGALERLERMK